MQRNSNSFLKGVGGSLIAGGLIGPAFVLVMTTQLGGLTIQFAWVYLIFGLATSFLTTGMSSNLRYSIDLPSFVGGKAVASLAISAIIVLLAYGIIGPVTLTLIATACASVVMGLGLTVAAYR